MTDDLRAKIAELRQRRQEAAESWGFEEKPGSAFLGYVAIAANLAPLLADTVERLAAENERLRAALRPFAEFYAQKRSAPTVEECQRAVELLEGKP